MIMEKSTDQRDGKLYKVPGYVGVKRRFIKQGKIKKSDWSFYIYYRIGGRKGKQILQKVGLLSQGMSAKKASKIRLKKILETEKKSVGTATISEIWEEYKIQKKNISSFHSVKNLYKMLAPFYDKTPQEIKTADIRQYKIYLENCKSVSGKNYSQQTIVHIIKFLRTLINFGIRNELCEKNEKLKIELPYVNNCVSEFLTDAQLKKYTEEIEKENNPVIRLFLSLALYTGMRKKAISFLKWSDIDFKNNLIYLSADYAKKRKADYIPLPMPVKKILLSIPQNNSFIFLNDKNKPLYNYAQKAKTIKEKIGLPQYFRPLYMLRHNFASILASHGTDLYTIQKLLTHNSPAMTQRYAHLNDRAIKQGSRLVVKIIQQDKRKKCYKSAIKKKKISKVQ